MSETPGYLAAREGAAWAEIAELGLLSVAGPDRRAFLHGLLSCEVRDLRPGSGRAGLILTPRAD